MPILKTFRVTMMTSYILILLCFMPAVLSVNEIKFSGKAADKIISLISDSCNCKCRKEKPPCKVSTPVDCGELDKATCKSGIYTIFPEKTSGRSRGFEVYCEMEKQGGGWTVIQRRLDGTVNFYKNWDDYKHGFGNLKGEFWLGNEHLHQITRQGKYKLRIDMEDFEHNKRYAEYSKFSVGDEKTVYKLEIDGYQGTAEKHVDIYFDNSRFNNGSSLLSNQIHPDVWRTAKAIPIFKKGDALSVNNGQKFSAKDKDVDTYSKHCAQIFKGAWWYTACHHANLNGQYLKGKHKSNADGVNWRQWKGYHYSLKRVVMMIRRD